MTTCILRLQLLRSLTHRCKTISLTFEGKRHSEKKRHSARRNPHAASTKHKDYEHIRIQKTPLPKKKIATQQSNSSSLEQRKLHIHAPAQTLNARSSSILRTR